MSQSIYPTKIQQIIQNYANYYKEVEYEVGHQVYIDTMKELQQAEQDIKGLIIYEESR